MATDFSNFSNFKLKRKDEIVNLYDLCVSNVMLSEYSRYISQINGIDDTLYGKSNTWIDTTATREYWIKDKNGNSISLGEFLYQPNPQADSETPSVLWGTESILNANYKLTNTAGNTLPITGIRRGYAPVDAYIEGAPSTTTSFAGQTQDNIPKPRVYKTCKVTSSVESQTGNTVLSNRIPLPTIKYVRGENSESEPTEVTEGTLTNAVNYSVFAYTRPPTLSTSGECAAMLSLERNRKIQIETSNGEIEKTISFLSIYLGTVEQKEDHEEVKEYNYAIVLAADFANEASYYKTFTDINSGDEYSIRGYIENTGILPTVYNVAVCGGGGGGLWNAAARAGGGGGGVFVASINFEEITTAVIELGAGGIGDKTAATDGGQSFLETKQIASGSRIIYAYGGTGAKNGETPAEGGTITERRDIEGLLYGVKILATKSGGASTGSVGTGGANGIKTVETDTDFNIFNEGNKSSKIFIVGENISNKGTGGSSLGCGGCYLSGSTDGNHYATWGGGGRGSDHKSSDESIMPLSCNGAPGGFLLWY